MIIDSQTVSATFYYIAVFSTLVFAIKTLIFAVTGGDSEVFADFNTEFETETSFDFFSIQSILAFFMGFGWVGLAALKQWGFSIKLTFLAAIAFGLCLMFLSAYLMYLVKKLNKKIVTNYSECIGKIAKTYTAFSSKGNGQIEININNKLSIENAINISDESFPAFQEVKITDYQNNTFYIDKK